jgi:hypothetical protein
MKKKSTRVTEGCIEWRASPISVIACVRLSNLILKAAPSNYTTPDPGTDSGARRSQEDAGWHQMQALSKRARIHTCRPIQDVEFRDHQQYEKSSRQGRPDSSRRTRSILKEVFI